LMEVKVSTRKSRIKPATSRIVNLDLKVDPQNWSYVRILDAVNHGKLEIMELKNCTQTNDDLLFEVSPFLSCLRVLNLWGCVQVTNAGVAALAEHCKRLEFLTLAGCLQITDKGIMSFADSCTTLTMIDLNGCPNITRYSLISLILKESCTG